MNPPGVLKASCTDCELLYFSGILSTIRKRGSEHRRARNAKPTENGHLTIELGRAQNAIPIQNRHKATVPDRPCYTKPIQDGYLTIEDQFGKNGTIPVGDCSCRENNLSIFKRKETGDLYGGRERNGCIQTGPELGLARDSISIQNGDKVTELDRACYTKPSQNRHQLKIISYLAIPIWRLRY